ncbi:MAG: DUF2239 family protein [Rudaea sp.]
MTANDDIEFIAFDRHRQLARGSLSEVARAAKHALDGDANGSPLIFGARDSRRVEVDLRGTLSQVLARIGKPAASEKSLPAGPGRPKLGVVAREVTLLPRHWDWLGRQPGGASAAMRRLVEQARRGNDGRARMHQAMEAVERFMLDLAGDLPGYEEASRAFYRRDSKRFATITKKWPADVRAHARELAEAAWKVMAEIPQDDRSR